MSARSARILLILILILGASTWILGSLPNPNSRSVRWDERHSMRNVQHLLENGGWRPTYAWYPALSHLPLTGILKVTLWAQESLGFDTEGITNRDGTPGPWAYWIGRWLSTLTALLTVLFTYTLGKRMFSRPAAVLAALFLVASPSFHWHAVAFKPDMLALCLTVLAFTAAVAAIERPALRRYLLAGGLVGLAASAKQTGALSAIPLILATALTPRKTRYWVALGMAGLLSCLVFYAIHPDLNLISRYLSIGERYEHWASGKTTEIPTLVYLPLLAVRSSWHGPLVGAFALLGVGALGVRLARSRFRRPELRATALLIGFVVLYPVACSIVSSHPKDNIFLPTMPFTALAAAWCMTAFWERLGSRAPSRTRQPLLVCLVGVLLVILGAPFIDHVYANSIQQTTQQAASRLVEANSRRLAHLTVISEDSLGALRLGPGPFFRQQTIAFERSVESLLDLPSEELDLADFELFPLDRLSGPRADDYRARLARCASDSHWVLEPRFPRLGGPALVVLKHPWKTEVSFEVEWASDADEKGLFLATFPGKPKRGRVVSLDLPWPSPLGDQCTLWLNGQRLALFEYHRDPQAPHFMTPRIALRGRKPRLRLLCSGEITAAEPPPATLILWQPVPASLAESSADGAR